MKTENSINYVVKIVKANPGDWYFKYIGQEIPVARVRLTQRLGYYMLKNSDRNKFGFTRIDGDKNIQVNDCELIVK